MLSQKQQEKQLIVWRGLSMAAVLAFVLLAAYAYRQFFFVPVEPIMIIPNRLVPAKPKPAEIRTVTAYTSRVEETDSTPCIAADGTDICRRFAAGDFLCAANFVPFGTVLRIVGVGDCTVVDRMARRFADRVDLYFGYDLAGAFEFGRRDMEVEIVR
jgi:3D (Asp-Asp-Asp) domain-containing protein